MLEVTYKLGKLIAYEFKRIEFLKDSLKYSKKKEIESLKINIESLESALSAISDEIVYLSVECKKFKVGQNIFDRNFYLVLELNELLINPINSNSQILKVLNKAEQTLLYCEKIILSELIKSREGVQQDGE